MLAKKPKQYNILANGNTILEQSIENLLSFTKIDKFIVALKKGDNYFKKSKFYQHKKLFTTCIGGENRIDSVISAMDSIKKYCKKDDWVIIHDSVRPCINKNNIVLLFDTLKNDSIGGILATPIVETIKKSNEYKIIKTIKRENLYLAQTPQLFRYNILLKSLSKCKDKNIIVTDEAQAIEYIGLQPKIVLGNTKNIKITYKEDIKLANLYL